jgi:hypothetical protein
VKEDSVDRFLVNGKDIFPGQEMVNSETVDQLSGKGETLGYAKQTVTPSMVSSSKMKGKTNGSKATHRGRLSTDLKILF